MEALDGMCALCSPGYRITVKAFCQQSEAPLLYFFNRYEEYGGIGNSYQNLMLWLCFPQLLTELTVFI